MDLFVCVGSSCHLKNSKEVISELNRLITDNDLVDKVSLKGSFCMGKCANDGVSVKIGEKVYSLKVENVEDFFKTEVIGRL